VFFEALASSPTRVLLTDYDGTLAPFRRDREDVFPDLRVAGALRALAEEGRTRLVIVSGRALSDLVRHAEWLRPRPELWGSHGLERWTPGRGREAPPVARPLGDLLDNLESWMSGRGGADLFERKPYGFALHERPDPSRYPEIRDGLLLEWSAACARAGLRLFPFDGGIEFRTAAATKGNVIRTILGEAGPEAAIAYLGDDATDEDAFEALAERGLSILVRARPRATKADVRLRPPDELEAFLERWLRIDRGSGRAPASGARA
jgi:trehalose-phosphatase